VELVNRINAFFGRLQRFGYLQCRMTAAELMNKSDHDLFCKLQAPTHALNHLLPPARNCISLRIRGHSNQLPDYSTDLHKKSFLMRCLRFYVPLDKNRLFRRRVLLINIAYIQNIGRTRAQNQLIVLSVSLS